MRKKNFSLIIFISMIIGSLSPLNLIPLTKAYYLLYHFDTDRDAYHVSGEIGINATWELNVASIWEEEYVQVQIYNSSNALIWNSSKYAEPGDYDESWFVNISNLTFLKDEKSILFVRFFYHYFHMITMNSMDVFMIEKQVTVNPDRIECQLNNFKEVLANVEVLDIEAQFYDLINDTYIVNQEIFFEMLANDSLLYDYNFTTNSMGEIEFSIDVLSQMSLGNNTLRFSITNSQLFNDTVFEYSVFVGQPEAGGLWDNIIIVLIVSFFGIIGIVGLMVFIRIRK